MHNGVLMKVYILLICLLSSLVQAKENNPLCESSLPDSLKKSFSKLTNKTAVHLMELGLSVKKPKYFYSYAEKIDSAINFSRSSMCATNTKDVTYSYLLRMQTACFDQCRQGSCLDSGKDQECKTFSSSELSTYLMCLSTCDSVIEQYNLFADQKKIINDRTNCSNKTAIDDSARSVQKIVKKLETDAPKSPKTIPK